MLLMVGKRSTKTTLHCHKATPSWRHSSHHSERKCEGLFFTLDRIVLRHHPPSQSPAGVERVRDCVVLCASLERADNRHAHSIHRLLGRTCGREGCDPCRLPRLPKKSLVFFVSHRQWAFLGYSPNIGHFRDTWPNFGVFFGLSLLFIQIEHEKFPQK